MEQWCQWKGMDPDHKDPVWTIYNLNFNDWAYVNCGLLDYETYAYLRVDDETIELPDGGVSDAGGLKRYYNPDAGK